VRFSTTGGAKGSADAIRDTHGMAVRFYPQQSVVDFVGLHIPMFFIRDAMKFPSKVHSGSPDPMTGMSSPDSAFDFLCSTPEGSGAFCMIYSDRGVPFSWRHVDGYGINVFKLVNDAGEVFYCKWEFEALAGTKFLSNADLKALGGSV
jgi:catalase